MKFIKKLLGIVLSIVFLVGCSSRYEYADYGSPGLNLLALLGLIIAGLAIWKLPRPWPAIIGVTAIWSPLVMLQIQLDRPIFALAISLIALLILKSVWNDD